MTPITQPQADEEIRKEREWRRQGMVPFCGAWTPEDWNHNQQARAEWHRSQLVFASDPTVNHGNPVEIDWLEINKEFS